jgi:hypothetical protein
VNETHRDRRVTHQLGPPFEPDVLGAFNPFQYRIFCRHIAARGRRPGLDGPPDTLSAVIGPLAVAIHVLSLALAGWAFVEFYRHRAPTRPLFAGLGVVELLILIQVVVFVVRLSGGQGPTAGSERVTLVGYLLTAALLPPAGAVLARMEPTRWGSLLIGAAAVIVPVLVLRLGQIWNG